MNKNKLYFQSTEKVRKSNLLKLQKIATYLKGKFADKNIFFDKKEFSDSHLDSTYIIFKKQKSRLGLILEVFHESGLKISTCKFISKDSRVDTNSMSYRNYLHLNKEKRTFLKKVNLEEIFLLVKKNLCC